MNSNYREDKQKSMIFELSYNSGKVPSEWKCANVTPIFKKGSKASPNNYRPVSLTSVVCKVMESIIKDKIVDHLCMNNLIFKSQHGFMKKRSCLTKTTPTFGNVGLCIEHET